MLPRGDSRWTLNHKDDDPMPNRRRFIQTLSALPFVGGFFAAEPSRAAATSGERNFFEELGIRPIINAAGTYTMFTATLMWPEAVKAIEATSRQYVRLTELSEAVGARIARLLGCEDALVTSGAAGALTLGTAACMTAKDPEKILRIPDTTGMKDEVIIQKAHRFAYDHAVRNCGVRLVEVETREQLIGAINEQTALMLFLNKNDPQGQVKKEEFVRIGKQYGVPTFNDAAADVPPVDNLTRYLRMGFDLVTFSGGKGLRGPQSAGLLLGRKDLIEAARLNTLPHSDTIGRGMKVNKEEMVAMLVALETYLAHDHEAEWRRWEEYIERIRQEVLAVAGIRAERFVPELANAVPHLRIEWQQDQDRVRMTPDAVVQALRDGDPSIEPVPLPPGTPHVEISSWTLQPGEELIVARRLREVLAAAA
jgi:uncharacterized pyridoxal phosphate-dependent enzyme